MKKEDIKLLPKAELHCHLDGSLSKVFFKEVLGREPLDSELTVGENCKSLTEYLEKFNLPLSCLTTRENFKRAGLDFIRQANEENVKYIEVRFSPILSTNETLSTKDTIEGLIEGLRLGKEMYNVDSNIIICAMRHLSVEQNKVMFKEAREYLGNGVCAVDLAGDENSTRVIDFSELFNYARSLEMPITIHAGECGRTDEIVHAIELGARRIGHGIAAYKDKDLMKLVAKKGIGFELCPISNLQTKAVNSMSEYPLQTFLQNNMFVSINTDNRTVSNTTLTKEYMFIQDNYKVSDEQIIKLIKNSIETAFCDDNIKDKLIKGL